MVFVPVAQLNLDRRIRETYKISELNKSNNLDRKQNFGNENSNKIMHVQDMGSRDHAMYFR